MEKRKYTRSAKKPVWNNVSKSGVKMDKAYYTKKLKAQYQYDKAKRLDGIAEVKRVMSEWEEKKKEIRSAFIAKYNEKHTVWYDTCDDEIEELIEKELIARAKDSYVDWVRLCMGDSFVETEYHIFLCLMCQDAADTAESGKDFNATVSCTAQSGKSEMVAKHFPSWFIGRHPFCDSMLLTSDGKLAEDFGSSNRSIAKQWWEKVFGVQVSKSTASKTEIGVEEDKGIMRFKGITGTFVGRGAVLNIIDDPYPNEEYVNSKTMREKTISTVRNDIFTRARGKADIGCIRFVIHTRRHEEDLIGVLDKEFITADESPDGVARKKWRNVTIPYFAVDDKDPLGRKVGEPLAPKRGMDTRWGLNKRSDVGLRTWNAQYMQNPMLDNGSIFKREWFKEYRDNELPMMFENVVLSCDLSNQNTANADFAAFQVWAYNDGNFYLLARGKKRCSFTEQVEIIKTFILRYKSIRMVLVEKKATGTAMVDYLKEKTNITVVGYDPGYQKKDSRASAASVQFEAGRVYLPSEKKDPTIENYKNELMGFPNLAHDDEVDATAQCLIYLSEKKRGRVIIENNPFYDNLNKFLLG